MSSDLIRHPVRWTSSYETTEAVQPVAPIKGILRDLRSNQWLVLTRSSDTEKSEFFPFRKSELVERLADAEPLSIASEVLNLPEHGAKAVNKRIWSVESREDEPVESLRMVWIDERGALLGVGVSRYDLSIQRTISEHELIMETRAIAMEKEVAIEDHVRGLADTEQKPNVVRKTGAEPPSLIVPVFYATDRKRDPKSPAEDVHFTSERAPNEVVSLGVCSVSIPKTHHIGKLERPPKWKIWARPKRNEHVMLLSTIELSTEEFWNQLNASVAESTRQDVFIFVHGYNVSFEVAALRSAQLATDLSFQGAPIMFSWPSKGGLARYLSDEGAIQWSRPHLRRFIEDVCTTSNADVVHLIAHSMGSRALVEVVEALSKASLPKNTLKQLIFAAPDVDSGVFQQVAKVLSTTCARVTLYASDRDKALKLSKTVSVRSSPLAMRGLAGSVCGDCERVVEAPAPARPIERGLPGPDLLAHVLVSKFADHMPLYRQSEIFAREGIDLDRSTLAGWVGAASELVAPLVDEIRKYVLAASKIHADDTPVPVLAPGNGKTRTGRLWTYVRDDRPAALSNAPAVWFAYSEDRRGEHPQQHLKDFTGALQADAYSGLHHLYGDGRIYEVGCWAHARRKFHDIHVAHQSPTTTKALRRIGQLYAIEEEVRGKQPDLRCSIRQARARPMLEDLRRWMEKMLRSLSAKSDTAAAIRYALSHWRALTRYVDDGLLEIDNSAAERALRAVAIGRKNYLFFGSDSGGERAAAFYALIGTAKLNGLDPAFYLRTVLSRIAEHPINRIGELLPWNMPPTLQSAQAA